MMADLLQDLFIAIEYIMTRTYLRDLLRQGALWWEVTELQLYTILLARSERHKTLFTARSMDSTSLTMNINNGDLYAVRSLEAQVNK